ncbi:MAG: cytosine/creatinine deaminase [Frankiales bacterium]|nr:cytosine/creatinine deaminase [Frankiales bacterium]
MLIRQARTHERPEGCNLVLADGKVADVTAAAAGAGLDVAGRVVLPAFVDAHVHLDKAYLTADCGPHLSAVLSAMAARRASTTSAETARLARRAADALVHNGTTAARVQVEIDPVVGIDLLTMHLDLAAAVADRLALQLVAFPQNGLAAPGMPELLARALAEGAHVVGGVPYVDADPAAHLDVVFGLAEQWQLPVDLHLDFTDDPSASLIPLVAERTAALGMAGRVNIGHVTSLAAMDPYTQASMLESLAAQGISLVVLPVTDVYLMGHGEPGTRSMAPYERATAAGVRTAIGNNNIGNAFAPFGNANQLQAAWLAGLLRRATDPAALLAAVTSEPAAILGLEPHGTEPGQWADLVVLDHDEVSTALLQSPPVRTVVRRGRPLAAWQPAPLSG